jgi:LmbE family N-acetylglucosaminyl deacetylase
MRFWLKIFFILLTTLLGIVGIGAYFFHSSITDQEIILLDDFPLDKSVNKIMVVFAHPDDEIVMAGTLIKLGQNPQNQLIAIYVTRGEAGPTGGIVQQEALGQQRSREMETIRKILNYKYLHYLDFPDSGLIKTEPKLVKAKIEQLIQNHQPQIILTYDDKVGLYGHPDHRLTGQWVKEIFEKNKKQPDFSVKKVYCATLGKKMIATALSLSEAFKKNYPKDNDKGLPPPVVAINIVSVGHLKKTAIQAHISQQSVMNDVFPFYGYFPAWFYFRVFDREYFAVLAE